MNFKSFKCIFINNNKIRTKIKWMNQLFGKKVFMNQMKYRLRKFNNLEVIRENQEIKNYLF